MTRLSTSFALVCLAAFSLSASADRVPPGTEDDIRARLAPFGNLCVAGQPCEGAAAVADAGDSSGGPRSGEAIYRSFCFACHDAGISDAPKLGNVEEWAPRLDKGMDALWETSVSGIGAMPPRAHNEPSIIV